MKKSLYLILLLAGLISICAAKVPLAWDHPDLSQVDHFKVYAFTGTTTNLVSTTTNLFATPNLPAGTYSFFITAVSPEGLESDPSNTVTATIPIKPFNNRLAP